ncbi:MAG: N-acetylmuramoyl-L-alanine amidase [Spirochaetaceae bacterium]|jgi:N-acetylmuramoyl-L-alanine amidase|nr:N-acetylmuramoyl-L-alanine amidase [Spirochaetaceae bacterium]
MCTFKRLPAILLLLCFCRVYAQDAPGSYGTGTARAASPVSAGPAPLQARGGGLTVDQALKILDATLSWDPFFKNGRFFSNGRWAAFSSDEMGADGIILYDGKYILNAPSPFLKSGELFFPQSFVTELKNRFDQSKQEEGGRFMIAAIIIDPGHGGKDEGASAEHIINGKKVRAVEKQITLAASKRLYEMLKNRFPGKKVLITRTGDTYPTLEDRVAQANSVPLKDDEAIIYVSVHANASLNKHARGFEVWYLSPEHRRVVVDKNKYTESNEIVSIFNSMLEEEFTTESIEMARAIDENFKKDFSSLMPSRGLKAEEWYVVRKARMPSVLVELGFVTNPEDAKLLLDGAYLNKMADSIYKGIEDFVIKFESWNLLG